MPRTRRAYAPEFRRQMVEIGAIYTVSKGTCGPCRATGQARPHRQEARRPSDVPGRSQRGQSPQVCHHDRTSAGELGAGLQSDWRRFLALGRDRRHASLGIGPRAWDLPVVLRWASSHRVAGAGGKGGDGRYRNP
jgi:hypothetical protein